MSVPVSVHQPAPDRTLATWLDTTPDLSSTNSTQHYAVDVDTSLRTWRFTMWFDRTLAGPAYRTSPNEVTSGPALLAFGHKGFAETLAVTLFGEPL